MTKLTLTIEILTSPLDGHLITLEDEAIWGAHQAGPLAFPWDTELHERQARLFTQDGHWQVEGYPARHGTYRLSENQQERVEASVQLETGDYLKASDIWLLIKKIG